MTCMGEEMERAWNDKPEHTNSNGAREKLGEAIHNFKELMPLFVWLSISILWKYHFDLDIGYFISFYDQYEWAHMYILYLLNNINKQYT